MFHRTLSLKKEISFHLIFWLIWLYFNLTAMDMDGGFFIKKGLFSWTWWVINLATFYLNYCIILPKVFNSFHWKKAVLGYLSAILFFIGFRYFIEQFLAFQLFGKQNYYNSPINYYIYDNLFFSLKPILLSSIFWLIIFSMRLLEYNRFILEENKNTEIKFLKAQINPHFIFNTLNNIYSMVYFESEKSLVAIEKLSQIMRFTTYDAQKERIKLLDEINYILAYIELEQLRHQAERPVNFSRTIENENIEIPPYILSPLVENALKHGMLSNKNPIEVTLRANFHSLHFVVTNEIGIQKKDKLGGIGLNNLKKRLNIHYPKRHSFSILTNNNQFIVQLQIDLQ